MTFEGPRNFHVDSESSADNGHTEQPVTNDPTLAEKFPQATPARKVFVDSHGVVHSVEGDADAAKLHQQDLADA